MTDERKNEIWALLPSDYQTYVKHWYQDVIDNNGPHEHIFEGLFGHDNLTAQVEEKPLFKSGYKAGDKVVITGSLCESRGEAITLVRHYDCPREANDYQKLWVGQFEDGHTCSIAEKDFTPTVEFEQAEEKPKEPRFKEDDVLYVVNPKHPLYNQRVRLDRWIADGKFWLVTDWSCGLHDIKESDLAPYAERKEGKIEKEAESQSNQYCRMEMPDDVKISDENSQDSLDVAESVEISTKEDAYCADNKHFVEMRDMLNYSQYRLDLAKEIAVKLIEINKISWTELGQDAVNLANEIVKRLKETEE